MYVASYVHALPIGESLKFCHDIAVSNNWAANFKYIF